MKKFIAIILSIVMAFSLIAIPVSAQTKLEASVGNIKNDAETAYDSAIGIYDELKDKDIEGAFWGTLDFARNFAEALHTLIHTVADIFNIECPFCGEVPADSVQDEAPETNGEAA